MLVADVKALFQDHELLWAYVGIMATALMFTLVPVVHAVAVRIGAIDDPGGCKTHESPTPLMGGGAIFLGYAFVMVLGRGILNFSVELKAVALGGTLVFVIGVLDDIWGLTARIRLVAQLLAVGILIKYGVVLSFLPETWWGDLGEILITIIWVAGITNALNFLDEMDGLACGSARMNALFFGLVALQTDQSFMMLLSLALAGSCLGFLPFNFRRLTPARIFLGDGGSNLLGFTLAGIGILGDWGTDNLVGLALPILILGVPIFDTTQTTIVRVGTGKVRSFGQWLRYTGRDHFHHRLSDLGIGNRKAVLVIYLVSIWLGLEALVLKHAWGIDAFFSIPQVGIVFALIGLLMVFVQNRYERLAELRGSRTQKANPVAPTRLEGA
ncbi:MAG: undecaprenyl-phosphate alpha-N-acetylglucosaminyl 1-phosphate transferase [Gemmatimonadetes bacterium]|nr:undecaprenyl-phosphate alpha-N-acetylglucosaminyl 1-phosphate transferase [Gemmatimonadota bacterium]|tara:strand:- start:6056 stop:7207 length:1152 start_codon:yes stop_codon:yes gene_type:complete